MRLICPNCGAQYAVADGVIPTGGRDVQCSNCSHTWFETPGASSNDQPPEARKITPPKPPASAAPDPDPNDPYSGSINDAFKNAADDEPKVAPAPQPPVDRKPVDRSVADILREEAALETAQRRTEVSGNIESQSDLGLSDPTPEPAQQPTPKAPKPVSPVSAVTTTAAATAATAAAAAGASRRELLPDIEEINSSLRSDVERAQDGEASDASAVDKKRRGFRLGFVTMLLIILVFVLTYIYADQIATMAPTLADTLKSYVDAVDVGRIWLDDTVQSILQSIASDGNG